MRIEQLVLDGFKSWATRTEINGWDASFNAITGLNGSGKSNILDAICFVLGLTNLSSVRAANLTDLIYKRGQAGITRASVSLTFDNSDKSKSPPGYESLHTITVTRIIALNSPAKYLINGSKATQQSVQTLFQSVQLNINNPNFVIMQGKITKVLNMKPPEILGMIEEAAGTSMFEKNKEDALRKMSKKEKKLDEINQLLAEEIQPKLERLREEKRSFLEYQKAAAELERLGRLVQAYEWVQAKKRLQECLKVADDKKGAITAGKQRADELNNEIANIKKEVKRIMKQRDKELESGGKIQKLEAREKELSKEIARIKTKLDLRVTAIADSKATVTEMEAAAEELQAQKDAKLSATADLDQKYQKSKSSHDARARELEQAESLLQSLITGLSSSASTQESAGYLGQLAAAQATQAGVASEVEEQKVRLDHITRELREKEPKAKKAASEDTGLAKEFKAAKADVIKLEQEAARFSNDEAKEAALSQQRAELQKSVRQLADKRDSLRNALSRLDFNYADPYRGFDRSKVKGLVANLVDIKPAHSNAATALEVSAGGRLYNVVVDDETTGSALLKDGKLQQRVTIIPLNKISAFTAAAEKLTKVKTVSQGKANLALHLVGYEDEIAAAMAYVFGNTLICENAETAKKVAFHPDIKMKSVTLQGDVYNPSGTLEGGGEPDSSRILMRVNELKQATLQFKEGQQKLAMVEAEWQTLREQMSRFRQIRDQLDLKRHEVSELEGRMAESSAQRIITEVENLKAASKSLSEALSTANKQLKEADAECKRIEKEMNEFKNNRESKLNDLKADITKRKAVLSKETASMKTLQREHSTAVLEASQMDADIEKAKSDVIEAEKAVQRAERDVEAIRKELQDLQTEHAKTEAQYAEETKQVTAFQEELSALETSIANNEQAVQTIYEEEKTLEAEIEKANKDVKAGHTQISHMNKDWPWIDDEKASFGVADGPFDFSKFRMADERRKFQEMQDRQNTQKKKINPKVMNMIDNVEKKERELLKMHSQVVKDKSKIEETIGKLDAYKKDALQKTWAKVNGDFGNIFAELLPGNFAKLEAPEGQDITEGLEVKVQLGKVWKQSLTELSGGQRSLIALSLIMSLLQFKPAPMYILDEVDAALDLSHTQHIGQLFRNRFKGSQFIVVSLKEGLFTNANVLFRARFRDGTSVIERTAQRSTSDLYDNRGRAVPRQRVGSGQSAASSAVSVQA